jgi:ABC exporter DevB family membrane fusion protein
VKKRLYIITAVALALVASIVYLLTARVKPSEVNTPVTPVKRYVAAEGKVKALPGLEVRVGSDLISRVKRFYVKKGESVKAGDVLLELDSGELTARLREAEEELRVSEARLKEVVSGSRKEEIKKAMASLESSKADLELARLNLERYAELYRQGVVPKAMLDEKEGAYRVSAADVRVAEEELKLVEKGPKEETVSLYRGNVKKALASVEYYRTLVEKTVLRSPISGKVIDKYLEEGEAVVPETPILLVADTENILINAEVDETDIGRINAGDPVEIRSDAYAGRVFNGEILRISDFVGARRFRPNDTSKNLDMKVVEVDIGLKDKGSAFKIGMTVDVRIIPARQTERGELK